MKAVEYICVVWMMLGLWVIDVSVTTLNLGIMTNGLWSLDPSVTYHIGLYSVILSNTLLVFYYDWRKENE